ncbi:MAG: polysaccharide biosynthesis protein, partial [Pedobacter sp.]
MFSKLEIVPRWIIFTIDICLSVFALLLAEIVRHNFLIDSIDVLALYKSVILTIILNTLVFFNIKTFAGIVRYTSAQDSFRILFAITLASLAVFFSNALVVVFFGQSLISNVTIIIYSLFSFLFLITYRVIVKYFFMY